MVAEGALATLPFLQCSQCRPSLFMTCIAGRGPHGKSLITRSRFYIPRRTLATSSSSKPSRRNRYVTALSTLDPTRLTPADHLTFSFSIPQTITFRSRHSPGLARLALWGYGDPEKYLHSDLSGFLYYHVPTRGPPLAGELRFRLTPSRDPASFLSGADLMSKRGVLWRIPLPTIAKFEKFAPVRHILVSVDGLVSQDVMDLALEQRLGIFVSGATRETRYLHSFGQPFDLPLDNCGHVFVCVGKDRIERTFMDKLTVFRDGRASRQTVQSNIPFLGTAVCCFEPSSLPEHEGRRVAVIRVLRSLESDPVRPSPHYSGPAYPPELIPRAGELLMVYRNRELLPWTGDVDRESQRRNAAAPLSILFDNAVEYGYP